MASSLSLEEDDDFDYDDRVYAMMKAQGKFNVDNLPEFTNSRAGIREVGAYIYIFRLSNFNLHRAYYHDS